MLGILFGKVKTAGAQAPLPRFKLGKRNWNTHPATLPDAHRVYAIGDVHGMAGLLDRLLGSIRADAAGYMGQVHLVFLGDYIDRGPHSKPVLEILKNRPWPPEWQVTLLRGNHDQAALDFLDNPTTDSHWLAWGGDSVLAEYGLGLFQHGVRTPLPALAQALKQQLEACGHLTVLQNTALHYTVGDYLFVHAGVRPMLAVADQLEHDLMMIRDDFAGRPHGLPYKVVYGHTITHVPLDLSDRLGLDTGAFSSGVLTAAVLENTTVRFLQTKP